LSRSPCWDFLVEEGDLLIASTEIYFILGEDRCVGKDMSESGIPFGENLADKEPPVAILRASLAAHEGNTVSGCTTNEAIDHLLKIWLSSHRAIERVAFGVVVIGSRGPSSQLFTEEEIGQASAGERVLECLPVELGGKPRERVGANIHNHFDPLAREQLKKNIRRVIRVTDGPDRERIVHSNLR
jgi:hypothetical protein